jgi:uncharacterized protein YcfJ
VPSLEGRHYLEDTMKRIAIAVAAALTLPALAQTYYTPDRDRNVEERQDWRNNADRDPYRDGRYRGNRDNARVLESRPLYAANEAKQECWNPRAGHYEELRGGSGDHNALNKGTALGALVGGVAGHQVDSGTGTAVGAVLGGLAGNYLNRRNERDEQTDLDRSKCRVVAENGVAPRGYEVRYEYQGREYVTRTSRDPGQRLRLGEDIRNDGTPFDMASR